MDKILENRDKLIKGKKQVMKGLLESRLQKVIIASDNEEHFNYEIVKKCELTGTEYQISLSKAELGKICNIDVPCGVIGIEKN